MDLKKILIGEDSSVIQNLAKKVLEQQQYDVQTVKNGQLVLEKLGLNTYSLVLLDINMPTMDGFECIKAIRNLEGENKNLPVFAITGNAANFSEEQYLDSGFNEVLVKPLDFDMLVELANAYLNKKV
jgi:hypothetical protein